MKRLLKSIALWPISLVVFYLKIIKKLRPQSDLNDYTYNLSLARTTNVSHESASAGKTVTFVLYTPNSVCEWRAKSFSTKEPETLEWIENYGGAGAFFDVGANVGLYSLYYAKLFSDQVYSFEPSALNLGLLTKNISVNRLQEQIVVVPTPLASKNKIALLHMSALEEGGAHSTFGAVFGHDGLPLIEQMSYRIPGMTMDSLLSSAQIPEAPSLIKIDVDGIEHLILEGAHDVLRTPTLRSVLVEVNDQFRELASGVTQHLTDAGFELRSKRHSEMFATGQFSATCNQIWVRPESYPV
jgi:FkbM family methyltransferase